MNPRRRLIASPVNLKAVIARGYLAFAVLVLTPYPALCELNPASYAGAAESKCDIPDACQQVQALQNLTKKALTDAAFPGGLRSFNNEFSRVFSRLSNYDLACRYNKRSNLPPQVDSVLGQILRIKNAFKSAPDNIFFAKYDSPDYQGLRNIENLLGQLSGALGCGGRAAASVHRPCPETDYMEEMKKQSGRAVSIARAGAQVAKDQQIKQALQSTAESLENIPKTLDKVIALAKACALVRDFVNAVKAINDAGCDSTKLARGFDALFRSAGKIGEKLPLDPVSKQYFKLLASNESFFESTSSKLNPEQRWAKQFAGVEGYVPGGCGPVR